MSISKLIDKRRKQMAVKTLRELSNRIERGELRVVSQGLWNGVTQDKWSFHLELQENPVPVLAEESENS